MKHFFLSLLLILLMQSNSYAYLDPGTGSIFLQYLLVGIAAVASTATSFWQKARDFFIKTGYRTVPQMFVGDRLLCEGGSDGLVRMTKEDIQNKVLELTKDSY